MSRFRTDSQAPRGSGALKSDTSIALIPRIVLEPLCRELLIRSGTPNAHAETVVQHLLDADEMGVASHGVVRMPQYLQAIEAGDIIPAATPRVIEQSRGMLKLDGRRSFGQVAGQAMARALEPRAADVGIALAVANKLGHTGRIGAYPEALARAGFIALAACSGPPSGHWVAPFGGMAGRLATNPIAFAYPVDSHEPVVADFSTAAIPEGAIRALRNRGASAPAGSLRDAQGNETSDPEVLYRTPRGAIQPFGGERGYRGTALAILVEVLTTLLAEDDVLDEARSGSNLMLMAISVPATFPALTSRLSQHIRSSPPVAPGRPVLMPGDKERVTSRDGGLITIDRPTLRGLQASAKTFGMRLPKQLAEGGTRI